jgi:large subunit ribosomal protein L6
MSRIGKQPVAIPKGVEVAYQAGMLKVKGPKGQAAERMPRGIDVEIKDGSIRFKRNDDKNAARAAHGLARALAANMVRGVTESFVRELEIQGVGYRAEVSGKKLTLQLGFSHPVVMAIPDGIKVSVDKNTSVRVEGADRQQVGQFVANVRGIRPPEPYKGKGVRYLNEHVRRKVGKAGAAG